MDDLLELLFEYGWFLILMVIGFFWGSYAEKRHYKSIIEREKKYLNLPAIPMNFTTLSKGSGLPLEVEDARLVMGSVVLAEDFFKSFLASLKTMFGGDLTSYESLMDRARREAILRLKDDSYGADIIVNLRLDTSSISKEGGEDGKGSKSIEVVASGTAITFSKTANKND